MTSQMLTVDPQVPKDIKKLMRKFKTLSRQIPFVVSKTINDAAFDVRHSSVALFNRTFDVRNKRVASVMFRVKRSNKRNLEAHVFDRLKKDWLARQISGGTKTARGAKLLIPIEAKRSGKGTRDPRSYAKSFIGKTKSGESGIFQRFGRGGKRIRMLFLLRPTVQIPKRFPFYQNAVRVTQSVIDRHYAAAWRYALRTARL